MPVNTPPPIAADPVGTRHPIFVVAAGLATTTFIIAGLYYGRKVFEPVVLALLLSFVLAPVVNFLQRFKLPRLAAVAVAVLVALGVISVIGAVIGGQLADLAHDVPKYATTIETKIEQVRGATVGRVSEAVETLSHHMSRLGNATPAAGGEARQQTTVTQTTVAPAPTTGTTGLSPLKLIEAVLGPVLGPLATFGIVFVIAIFVLLQREDLRDRLIRLGGSKDLHRTTVALDDAAARLSRYFLSQLSINATFGIVIGIGLALIGVPSPLLWGILAGLLRFIPYVGAFLAAVLPVALASAVDPGWSMMFWTLGLFVVVELTTGQIVEPMLYGHSTGLSPLAVIIAAIFWTSLWGTVGLLISTPLTLCFVVLGRHFEALQFLDVMLGDRPALTPAESFYQRMLAGDPDEVLDQADQLLKEQSLTSYYDTVALKGLQLAAADAESGALSAVQLEKVGTAIHGLIADLASREEHEPIKDSGKVPPLALGRTLDEKNAPLAAPVTISVADAPKSDRVILCVAGRGTLDTAASEMLGQLLTKHGMTPRLLPYAAVSREGIATLDVTDIAMVCLSYLEISGGPAHLRYLLERLRARLPGIPMLVGVWPLGDAMLSDTSARSQLGADYATSSIAEAVNMCQKALAADADRTTAALPSAAMSQT